MNIGMITCTYNMRIYDYKCPADFNWGKMCEKYRKEFDKADFLKLIGEIRNIGFNAVEIWEPMFSYQVYTEEDAREMKERLAGLGIGQIVYCIGGWVDFNIPDMDKIYRFAAALGCKVISGTLEKSDADTLPAKIEECGKRYGIRYAIENHPAPSMESPEEIAKVIAPLDYVGANPDTGIFNRQGYDALKAVELLKDRIYHCHLKDTAKDKNGCLALGDGDAPLAGILKKFCEWDFPYMVSVEYEYPTDPEPGLYKSVGFINGVLKAVKV